MNVQFPSHLLAARVLSCLFLALAAWLPIQASAVSIAAGRFHGLMVRDDGSVRYFTVRESARLQTFPDGFELHGAWSEAMRQLGNAVPVALAQLVASSVAEKLIEWRWRQEIKARGIQ